MSVSRSATAQAALAIGALGVVFGDIGTSPLYTEQTVFNPTDPHPVKASTENIFGVVSLIFLVGDDHRHGHLRRAGDAGRQRRRGRNHGVDHLDPQAESPRLATAGQGRWPMTHAALVNGALFLILAVMDAAASDIVVLRL